VNKLSRNERAKLTATWLNGVSIAAIAVGGIGPTVAVILGTVSPALVRDVTFAALAWIVLALILHLAGRTLLRKLEE
jgi:hypothetical protein